MKTHHHSLRVDALLHQQGSNQYIYLVIVRGDQHHLKRLALPLEELISGFELRRIPHTGRAPTGRDQEACKKQRTQSGIRA